jgi:hypothetical protein
MNSSTVSILNYLIMKYLLIISFSLISLFSWTQNEKGLTIQDRYYFKYDDNSEYHYFSEIWPNSDFSSLDTFKIAVDENKEILISWSFFNETYDMFFPLYDTVQWFYNNTLLGADSYSFSNCESSGSCGSIFRAASSINQVKPGFYQLRYIGADSSLNKTKYPVVHVYEKEEASIPIEDTPIESTLYPNPVSGLINLEISSPINNGVMHVHNLQGQLIVSYPLQNLETTTQYDISQLNRGIYLFSVINNENREEVMRKKVLVNQ